MRDERKKRDTVHEGRKDKVKGRCGEEGVRRENESAPCYECNRGCGRRKIHDQDAIAMRDRTRVDFQTRLNQQIRLFEHRAVRSTAF